MTTVLKPAAAEATAPPLPSPFTPIADYGFLSDCHTGALVAPDGSVDWLCVPRFDTPSIFGSLLDREAGSFRFGPYGIHHPSERAYEPGTNVLTTVWKTPSAWLVVREALTLGPRGSDDMITPHTRPPTDQDADHMLVRTIRCVEGRAEVELVCEPVFDYGRTPAAWTLTADRHTADATGAGLTVRLRSDLQLGAEGNRVRGRHVLEAGETAFCVLSWAAERQRPSSQLMNAPASSVNPSRSSA
jgi:GH15 family glucan-1,4-alpha-glucosidase